MSILGWRGVLGAFSEPRGTLCLDFPGSGRSEAPSGELSVSSLAEAVVELMDYLQVSRISPVGISMGGFVALEMGWCFPERVEKLVASQYRLPPGGAWTGTACPLGGPSTRRMSSGANDATTASLHSFGKLFLFSSTDGTEPGLFPAVSRPALAEGSGVFRPGPGLQGVRPERKGPGNRRSRPPSERRGGSHDFPLLHAQAG